MTLRCAAKSERTNARFLQGLMFHFSYVSSEILYSWAPAEDRNLHKNVKPQDGDTSINRGRCE